ncbi:hypothetical protein QBC34DRAFT_392562 [Podospora aff. communis PSN243]|uniref:Zn(2)-C6 fungal-type domain-containing protein n=1 Tax=Podospora aff. communis PSN243 TaxID=3040156 RepID=A0AAV9H1V6_9PEZI|nr:hypothetical protein QBC34DRAFT_392562 [Podospora aff. communis PSN243]
MSFTPTQGAKASQACTSCKKQKRKCDKALPICGLCCRLNKACDYADSSPPPPTADDLASLQARLSDLEAELRASKSQPPIASHPSSFHFPVDTFSPSQSQFPSALFLDIDCFKYASLVIPPANIPVPPSVLSILSNSATVQAAISEYFATVHAWFPFISKKRLAIGTSLWEGGPDVAMLFLGMMLVCRTRGEEERGMELYRSAKGFVAVLVEGGVVSLGVLQGLILIAVWEMGMGVYPGAWMTVAQCARYVDLLGIPSFKESALVLGGAATWTEVEERRRAWWAVYVLDRAICLGNKKRYTMPELDETILLPVDDSAWDDGDPSRGRQISISTPLHEPQGPFTRLCQSAMLVSKTTTHTRSTIRNHQQRKPAPFCLETVTSLLETLVSFTHTLRSELPKANTDTTCYPTSRPHSLGLTSPPPAPTPSMQAVPIPFPWTPSTIIANDSPNPSTTNTNAASTSTSTLADPPQSCPLYFSLLPSRSLTLSAIILLLDIYSCPENLLDGPGPLGSDSHYARSPDEITMQSRAVTGLRETAQATRDLALEVLDAAMLPSGIERVSPLCLDAFYGGMATLHWLWKEGGDEEVQKEMEDIRRCMGRLGWRWKVAGEYVGMLRYHDVTTVMAWKGIGP